MSHHTVRQGRNKCPTRQCDKCLLQEAQHADGSAGEKLAVQAGGPEFGLQEEWHVFIIPALG